MRLTCWYCGNKDQAKFKSNAGYPTFRPKCKVCGTIIWRKEEDGYGGVISREKDGAGSHAEH